MCWRVLCVLLCVEAVEGARGRRRCVLYAEVARLAKRFLPDGSDSRPLYVSGRHS